MSAFQREAEAGVRRAIKEELDLLPPRYLYVYGGVHLDGRFVFGHYFIAEPARLPVSMFWSVLLMASEGVVAQLRDLGVRDLSSVVWHTGVPVDVEVPS